MLEVDRAIWIEIGTINDLSSNSHGNTDNIILIVTNEMPREGSTQLPRDGSSQLPQDGSTQLPWEGSTQLPKDGSTQLPEDGSTQLPQDGSTQLPKDGSTQLPQDGSTQLPQEGSTQVIDNTTNNNLRNIPMNDFFGVFFPIFSSPFTNNVNQHHFHNEVFDPIFELFGTSFNRHFRDNFSSNFRSNIPMDNIIIIIQESFRNAKENIRPPVSEEAIEKLVKFKLSEKYCKKNEKGEFEQPTCSVCLFDIKMEEETILVPCGHLYHSPCILDWFKQNNTCPVCRFELPPKLY